MRPHFVLVWVVLLVCSCSMGQEKEPAKRPIRLSLEVINKTIRPGETPKFKLTLHNEGKDPERIIDVGSRPDLQDTYYDLQVTQGDKVVSVVRAISDPGPIAEEDFLELKPGEKVTFQLTRFAAALESLLPSKYEARILFWQNPLLPAKTAYFSPSATFTVEK